MVDRTFDRTLLIRHIAICTAAIAAYILQSELSIGYTALAIVLVGALLNFLAFAFRTRKELARVCWIASPVIGVGSWTALIAVTRGVSSPFVAGLWLEIILSAMALNRTGVILVTFSTVAALWAQQLWTGIEGAGGALMLQSGFLFGMGGATFLVNRRWIRTQRDLSARYTDVQDRLAAMERQLAEERVLGELGENAGRLAHALKNTVHSLGGFVGLVERKLPAGRSTRAALAGLRTATDELEALARLTLDTQGHREAGEPRVGTPSPATCVERAVREISLSQPEVGWTTDTVNKTICHQVGSVHQETILKSLGLALDKDFPTYPFLGNTGTVALPITAAIAEERDFLQPGDRVSLLGIGSGLNCVMLGVEW